MKYTKLGNSDLHVSRICLGCMGFGDAKTGQHSWTVDEATIATFGKKKYNLSEKFSFPFCYSNLRSACKGCGYNRWCFVSTIRTIGTFSKDSVLNTDPISEISDEA